MTPRQVLQSKNKPATDSIIAVEPIRSTEQVSAVRDSLQGRDRVMFTLGVNTNLRASDILNLKVGNIDFQQQCIVLREKKTGKTRRIALSPEVVVMLIELLGAGKQVSRETLIFQSRKGGGVMTVSTLNHLVKKWCADVGLRGNFGSHTLRKTWAFIQYRVFGTDIAVISQELNHSNMRTTYRYLGITPDEVKAAYMRFI